MNLFKDGSWISIILIVLIILMVLYIESPVNKLRADLEYALEPSFEGVVLRKYKKKRAHGARVVVLNKKDSLKQFPYRSLTLSIFDNIEVGDSIYKKRMDSIFYLVKKDTIIKYNFMDLVKSNS